MVLSKRDLKIEGIVLEIDTLTFSGAMYQDRYINLDSLALYSRNVPYGELKRIYNKRMLQIWLEFNLPVIGKGEEFSMINKKPETLVGISGAINASQAFSDINKAKAADARYVGTFQGYDVVSPVSLEYFQKTLRLAKERNIMVVLVKLPVTREFDDTFTRHNFSTDEYYNVIFNKVDLILGNNYKVLDYHDIFYEHDEYFEDPDHLNYFGRDIFSKILYEDLEKLNKIP